MGSSGLITGAFSSDTTLPTPVPINKGGTGQTTAQAAIDALTAVSGASTNEVLTKDGSGNAVFAAASGAWVGTATSNLAMANYNITGTGTVVFTSGTFTISSGSITSTKTLVALETEGSASTDNLDVNAGSVAGNLLIYSTASSSRDVTIRSDTGTGKRHLLPADFTCDSNYDTATFCQLRDDDRIPCLSTSNNI